MSAPASVLAPAYDDMMHGPQQAFRCILEAMAHPGHIYEIPSPQATPAPAGPAMTAVILTLLDQSTPVWLDAALAEHAAVTDYIRFYCGSPLTTAPGEAAFALVGDAQSMAKLDHYNIGSAAYPETSTTVVVELDALTGGQPVFLRGPGLAKVRDFDSIGLPEWFWHAWAANRAGFPLGVDMIFTSGNDIAALPRSVSAEVR